MAVAPTASWTITWEPLPDDFVLDDHPVDNINQPALAAALTESLELAGRLPPQALTMTNYGLCATFRRLARPPRKSYRLLVTLVGPARATPIVGI